MNDLAILTTIYNHQNSPLVIKNLNRFIDFIKGCGLSNHLYLCEIIPDESVSDLDIDIGKVFTVHNSSPLWHKESAINFLLKQISNDYKYIVVADNDIILNDDNWHYKTCNLLKNHIMVQCFETIKYVGPDNLGIDKYYEGAVKCSTANNHISDGNPGAFIAYRRDYLSHTGGLFDKCLVGGGDTINIMPFFIDSHYHSIDIFDRVFSDQKIFILDYIEKSKQYISTTKHKKTSYIKNCHATHQYHGMIHDRSYHDRYNLINKLNSKNYIQQNNLGFYSIANEESSAYDLSKDLGCFFNNRSSDYTNTKPIIYNSNKYSNDNDNSLLWLSGNNCFNFRNINKAKISFKKPHDIKYINMIINGSRIDTKKLLSEGSMVLEISEPLNMIIDSDYIIPKQLSLGTDTRELSIYIDNIQITSFDKPDYYQYSLADVL
jgi:hypothetical protein